MQCVVGIPATGFPPSYRRATVMHATCASLVFCGMSTLQDRVPGLFSATRRLTVNWLWEIRGQGESAAAQPCRQRRIIKERPGRYRRRLERLGEAGFQEFSKFCCCLELRDWLQLLECRGEGIGEAPDRARPEFVVPRFEVQIVNPPGQVLRHFKSALDERLVDDNFGRDIGEFEPL